MLTNLKLHRAAPILLAAALGVTGCTPPGARALLDGDELLKADRPADAVRRLRTAVEHLPGNARAWNHLGLALHRSGQAAEAISAYREALRLQTDLAPAHFNLGMLYREAGENFPGMSALDAYQRAVDELNRYRELKGPRLARDDPSQTYLEELGRLIQREQARIERERARAQREA